MSCVPISAAEGELARRVLIINVTRIGDTLLATPALRAIARHFPNAHITCLGHPKRVEVLDNIPYLAKIGGITKKHAFYRGWRDAVMGPEYDYAFVWGHDAALLRYALRKARHVVAEKQRDAALDARLGCAFAAPPQNSIHAAAWYLALPQAAGIAADGWRLDYVVSDGESRWAEARLAEDGLRAPGSGPLIGLQVASFATKSYRDWPIGHFIALARRAAEAWPAARFILYGAADDAPRIAEFTRALPGKAVSYAGRLSLRETVALMHATDAYVGVDTGPTHLYSALQKPMVVLYHPSLPSALYKPLQHDALHAIDHPDAGPGAGRELAIGDITVDTVFSALRDALSGKGSRHPGMPAPGVDSGAQVFAGDPPTA